jgi:restriction system protein
VSDFSGRIPTLYPQNPKSVDKRSGITSDPNNPNDEEYIDCLVRQVIRVSIESIRIANSLSVEYSKRQREVMSTSGDTCIWGIHGGKTGDADSLFLQHSCVDLGWPKMGDLSALQATRDAYKSRMKEAYPDVKPAAVPGNAGQLFRFVHEMQTGNLVAYPSQRDRQIHFGRILGGYKYDAKTQPAYPNARPIEWLRSVPRTQFTQGALYEIGSAMSFFQLKNYADEFRAAVAGNAAPTLPASQDETVAAVADGIEEATRDYVIKKLSQDLKGCPLESFIVHLLESMGYHARLTRKNEPSVDVIAHKDQLGVEPPIIKVQVKSGDGSVTDKDVSALYGKLSTSEYGLFITLGTYTPPARNFESSKENLRLIDGEELVELIYQHYEHFDSRHKGLLPLRRVYVPQPLDSD